MPMVKLGEVAREYKETCKGDKGDLPIVGLEHLIPEDINLTCWSDDKENTFTKMFRKGHVLFGRRRAYLKKAAVAPFDGICSGDITVIEAIEDKLYPGLLPFIIQNDALFDFAVEKSAGSLSPRVKWQHLQDYEFFLPEMAKQKELAELLWAMDRTKQAYKQLISATDELVKSQFIEMFGDPETNPLHWKQLCFRSIITNANNGITRRGNDTDGQIVLRIVELQDGFIDYSNTNRIKLNEKEKKCLLCNGDLLFVRVNGNPDYVARSAIFSEIAEPVYHNDHIIRVHIDESIADVVFIREYVSYGYGKKQLKANIKTSAGQYSISQDGIGNIEIYLPPLDLQKQFAAFVQQTDKSKFELNQALEALNATYKKLISENLG